MTDNIIDLKTGLPISAEEAFQRKHELQDLADGLEMDVINPSFNDIWFVDSDVPFDETRLSAELDRLALHNELFPSDDIGWVEFTDKKD